MTGFEYMKHVNDLANLIDRCLVEADFCIHLASLQCSEHQKKDYELQAIGFRNAARLYRIENERALIDWQRIVYG